MANLKIDVTRLVSRYCEMLFDETKYAGKTLREWIAGIASGDYVPKNEQRLKVVFSWDIDSSGELLRCPACDKKFKPDTVNEKLWNFCPECGVRMERDKQ